MQETGDALVLLNPDSGEYFTLNDVGATVWRLCDGRHSISEMVEMLTREYEAPSQEIGEDVAELLDELERSHLVEIV